jgi:methylmalonyl-CoA/ethylmalonyl-CoA epimerase
MKVHHIGYLVDDIEKASVAFAELGFSRADEVVKDMIREIYILFLVNSEGVKVELIQPIDKSSPIYRLNKKHRNSPYHICYETDNLQREIENKINTGEYALLQPPQDAFALGGKVAFLINKDIGLIEIYSTV